MRIVRTWYDFKNGGHLISLGRCPSLRRFGPLHELLHARTPTDCGICWRRAARWRGAWRGRSIWRSASCRAGWSGFGLTFDSTARLAADEVAVLLGPPNSQGPQSGNGRAIRARRVGETVSTAIASGPASSLIVSRRTATHVCDMGPFAANLKKSFVGETEANRGFSWMAMCVGTARPTGKMGGLKNRANK